MAVQTNTPKGQTTPQDEDNSVISQPISTPTPAIKEHEPVSSTQHEEEKILSEIVRSSEAVDEQAEQVVRNAINEARLSTPEPKLPPDVADSGVKSANLEAKEVITKGTTINLPIDEVEYKKGLHLKIKTAVVNKVVFGVSSLLALALWVTRVVKLAPKHAMKVVFKKGD